MQMVRTAPFARVRCALALALCTVPAAGLLPHMRQAVALGNPSKDPPAPPALVWPANDPIVESEPVGYLVGGGGITGAGDYRYPHVHDFLPNPTGGTPQRGPGRAPKPGEL